MVSSQPERATEVKSVPDTLSTVDSALAEMNVSVYSWVFVISVDLTDQLSGDGGSVFILLIEYFLFKVFCFDLTLQCHCSLK